MGYVIIEITHEEVILNLINRERLFESLLEQKKKWFMRYVEKKDKCWLWKGKKDKYGYAKSRVIKLTWHAHRASYFLFKEDIPKGMCVCHKCDMPSCVNPEHLFLGTQKENVRDMIKKGRKPIGENHPSRKNPDYLKRGSNHWKSNLTEKQVEKIKSYEGGYGIGRRLAKRFKVSPQTISNIRNGKIWKHV